MSEDRDDELTPHDRHIADLCGAIDYFMFTEGKSVKDIKQMVKTAIKLAEMTERERRKIRAKWAPRL